MKKVNVNSNIRSDNKFMLYRDMPGFYFDDSDEAEMDIVDEKTILSWNKKKREKIKNRTTYILWNKL